MKVILLEHIRGIGHAGDIKEVNDGYARNFLFPRKAAKPATEGIVKDVALTKAKKLEVAAMAIQETRDLAAKLAGSHVELTGKANAKGTLFAAITAITLDGHHFTLPEAIKTTGEHPIVLALAHGITVTVTVVVMPGR